MKSKILAITLLASTIISGSLAAQTCYNASGSVTTENVTSTLQIGSISLTLSDQSNDMVVFNEIGTLVGNITGNDGFGTTLLSHVAKFPQGNRFVTNGDVAGLAFPEPYYSPVRNTVDGTPEGTPCSFWIREKISNIVQGTRFFNNVSSVDIYADGYISSCPDDNENYFEISGSLCVD